jgi:hypothetical protein
MEYTKGEWKVGKATDPLGYETPIYADTDEGRPYEIVTVHTTVHIYNGEQIANARLIAAAPRMAQLLEKLVSQDGRMFAKDIKEAKEILTTIP